MSVNWTISPTSKTWNNVGGIPKFPFNLELGNGQNTTRQNIRKYIFTSPATGKFHPLENFGRVFALGFDRTKESPSSRWKCQLENFYLPSFREKQQKAWKTFRCLPSKLQQKISGTAPNFSRRPRPLAASGRAADGGGPNLGLPLGGPVDRITRSKWWQISVKSYDINQNHKILFILYCYIHTQIQRKPLKHLSNVKPPGRQSSWFWLPAK